jgi:hypothetical protein
LCSNGTSILSNGTIELNPSSKDLAVCTALPWNRIVSTMTYITVQELHYNQRLVIKPFINYIFS